MGKRSTSVPSASSQQAYQKQLKKDQVEIEQLNDILGAALSKAENKDSKKLLAYLKDKMLIGSKGDNSTTKQTPEDISKIEKEL